MHDGDLDDGWFLVIPATGIVLILIGIGCVVLAAFPYLFPSLLTYLFESMNLPPELSSFLLAYFLPEVIQPFYLTISGTGAIGTGIFFTIIEYREERQVRAMSKE